MSKRSIATIATISMVLNLHEKLCFQLNKPTQIVNLNKHQFPSNCTAKQIK